MPAPGTVTLESGARIPADWRACPHCGLISSLPPLRPDHVAICPRCSHALWKMRQHPFNVPLACGLAALMLYCFALIAPFLEITAFGNFQQANIETGPVELIQQSFLLVGYLVLAVTVILPGVKLGIMLVTLLGIETKWLPPRLLKALFRWYGPLTPWAMIDVYLLGFLVAYTKLIAMAAVHLDTALYALAGLMAVMAAADATLDSEAVWRALDAMEPEPQGSTILAQTNPAHRLIACETCDLINLAEPHAHCRRCDAALHERKPDSIARSWALLAAAAMFYIPANIYPVMLITQLGTQTPFTIFGGIEELAQANMWPLALLVFFASITIPVAKLITLAYMLIQTQRGSGRHLVGRTRAFRAILFIGRWSMIDVFMISILVALVRFGQFTNIRADIGAACFATVVVLTMFAVDVFDPRLMWDAPLAAGGKPPDHLPASLETAPV